MLFYGFATYGNAGFLREQVCKYMCPYARFQSAMFDKDTLIISYDAARGEPRGSRSRKADPKALGLGDCIDCTLCVQVCPTGIDIRKGLQYECIGCAACIDVCDGVMDKMDYPRGLIRYATQNGMAQRLDARADAAPRAAPARADLQRGAAGADRVGVRGQPGAAQRRSRSTWCATAARWRAWSTTASIENVYRLQVMNATEQPQRYRIAVDGLRGVELASRAEVEVDATEARWVPVSVRIDPQPPTALGPGAHATAFPHRTSGLCGAG